MFFDDIGFCIEISFENSKDVPYETYRVGTVQKLLEVTSAEFLNELKVSYGATGVKVTHIYINATDSKTKNKIEFSMGNDEEMQLTLFEGEEEYGNDMAGKS